MVVITLRRAMTPRPDDSFPPKPYSWLEDHVLEAGVLRCGLRGPTRAQRKKCALYRHFFTGIEPDPSARPFIRERATEPFWYGKWSRNGQPVIRALGRAWVESDANGSWRP